MGVIRSVKSLISMMRSANRRLNYVSSWRESTVPIDNEVLLSRRDRNRNFNEPMDPSVPLPSNSDVEKERNTQDTRIAAKPVEVVGEIMMEQPTFVLADLKKQIKVVSNRIKVLREQGVNEHNLQNEHIALEYLKARERYPQVYKLFKWPTTNQTKVLALQNKYKLHTTPLNEWSKLIPQEAISEIEKFAKACFEVSKKYKPEFRVIVDQLSWDELQKEKKRRDPILLALSPFGNWYYILGAWDKEVEYVDDLIYNGK